MLSLLWGGAGVLLAAPLFQRPVATSCHRRTCFGNVKIQAMALGIYGSDYEERMPRKEVWMDRLSPYVRGNFNLQDPAVGEKGFGYGFNANLSEAVTPTSPELTVAVFDSWKLRRNASDSLTSLPPDGRHEGKNNFGFVDGHAKALSVTPP